jgi:hypothetical protein
MLARLGQTRNFSQASLPGLGKGKIISNGACPSWAKANLFSGELAQVGQRRIGFISYLPKPGKHESEKM